MTEPTPAERQIAAIVERNRRVEADKAWETSSVRRVLIATITYLSAVVYSFAIGAERPWLQSAIPACGFLLSTITLPAVKRIWLERWPKVNVND